MDETLGCFVQDGTQPGITITQGIHGNAAGKVDVSVSFSIEEMDTFPAYEERRGTFVHREQSTIGGRTGSFHNRVGRSSHGFHAFE